MLGWTAKPLTPAGVPPNAAVSPLGRPSGFGLGTLMADNSDQSLVRVTAIEESSDAEMSLDLVGKERAVIVDE